MSSYLQVAKFKDPRDACAAIVAESYRLWLQFETRTDDITIIVVHVNGLTDVCDLYFPFSFIQVYLFHGTLYFPLLVVSN